MSKYAVLRSWAGVLKIIGIVGVILATFGVISWAIEVDGFWATMGVIFIGAPIALLLAAWPIALGEAMAAIADIGDSVAVPGS